MWVLARDAGGQLHRTGKTPHREETVLAWQNRFTSSSAPASMLRQPVTCGNTQSLLRAAELGERECNGRPTRDVRMTHGRPARKPTDTRRPAGAAEQREEPHGWARWPQVSDREEPVASASGRTPSRHERGCRLSGREHRARVPLR